MIYDRTQRDLDRLKAKLLDEGGWCCHYCEKPLTWKSATLDHMIPQCQGGGHEDENLAVACQPCNSAKGGRSVFEWLEPEAYYAEFGRAA